MADRFVFPFRFEEVDWLANFDLLRKVLLTGNFVIFVRFSQDAKVAAEESSGSRVNVVDESSSSTGSPSWPSQQMYKFGIVVVNDMAESPQLKTPKSFLVCADSLTELILTPLSWIVKLWLMLNTSLTTGIGYGSIEIDSSLTIDRFLIFLAFALHDDASPIPSISRLFARAIKNCTFWNVATISWVFHVKWT